MGDERTQFPTATAALAWWFAMRTRAADVAAVDPSRDRIDGLTVDRDERAWWVQSVRQAVEHLIVAQGSPLGARLLHAHLRPRQVEHVVSRRKGRFNRLADPTPLWELYRLPGMNLSQRAAVELYWDSLRLVEDFMHSRGWIERRTERRSRPAEWRG